MITLNLDNFFFDESEIDELLKDLDDDILLFDLPEGSRFDGVFSKVHDILEDNNVWYLCSDLNIKERYKKWCIDNKKPEIYNTLYFPFTVRIDSMHFVKQEIIDELNNFQKNKNFIQLTSSPAPYRIATLSNYYKHSNYEYSLTPQFHFTKDDENSWIDRVYSCLFDEFDILSNTRTLTEIDISEEWIEETKGYIGPKELTTINNKLFDKDVFNAFLPKECFQSNCDVVVETYVEGPTYYTEKTWKEILFQRPFILLGNKGSNHKLEELGFKLYNEIFDYSFDLLDNPKERMREFHKQIERYLESDIEVFTNKLRDIEEKLIYNRNKYISAVVDIEQKLEFKPYELYHYLFLSSFSEKREYLPKPKFDIIKNIARF